MVEVHRTEQGVSDVVVGLVDENSIPYGIRQTSNQPQVMLGNTTGDVIGTPVGESGDIALAVHVEHLHQSPWTHSFDLATATTSTLNGAVAVGSKTLILNDATGFLAGGFIDIHQATAHSHLYRKIITVVANTLTIDSGVDIALPDGSEVIKTSFDMAVNGAVTPVVFTIEPGPGEKIDVERLLLSIAASSAPDDVKFGDLDALVNGVHLRKSIDGGASFDTLAIWRTNGDMKLSMFDVDYTTKAGGGDHGVNGRWSIFHGTGAVVNLDQTNDEIMECVIQDDLSALTSFRIAMQGHIEV